MAVADECCVTSLREPVQILSLAAAPSSQQSSSDLKLFSDSTSLDKYLSSDVAQNYSCRFMCVTNSASSSCPTKKTPLLIMEYSARSANATLGARYR